MITHRPLALPPALIFKVLGVSALCTLGCNAAAVVHAAPPAQSPSPGAAQPDAAQPDAAQPDAARPDAARPDAALIPFAKLPPIADPPPAADAAPLSSRAQEALDEARRLRNAQRFTEAAIELEKALRIAPDDPRILRALALTHWLDGNAQQAREYAEAARHITDNDLVSHYLLGRLAARRFENDEAVRQYRIALRCQIPPDVRGFVPLVLFHLAETLAADGYLTAAIEVYDRFAAALEALSPDDERPDELATLDQTAATAAQRAAAVCAQLGRYESAADRLLRAYGDDELPVTIQRQAAEYLLRAGRLDAALQHARKAAASSLPGGQADPTGQSASNPAAPQASPLDLLREIHAARGTPEELVTDLRALVNLKPNHATPVMALAAALVDVHRPDEAEAVLRRRLADHPEEAQINWALVGVLSGQQSWTSALNAAADAIRTRAAYAEEAADRLAALPAEAQAALLATRDSARPGDYAQSFLYGVLASTAGDTPAAVTAFNAALVDRPAFVPARIHLARLHLANYAWADAIAAAAPADVDLPADTRREQILGDAHVGLNEVDKAVEHYQAAIRLNRANTAAMLALAELYADTGQSNAAIRQLEALVEADPLNERGRELLFRAYLADQDRRAAAEQLAQLRRFSASPTCIARCVAWLEFDPLAPDAARFGQTLRDAVAAYRPDAETLHLIALSCLQERRPADAVAVLQQALALEPGHRASAEMLAAAYRANLDFEMAAEARRTLLERYPNHVAWRADLLEMVLAVQRFDEAQRLIQEWLTDTNLGDDARRTLRDSLLTTLLLQHDYAAALALLEEMRAANPADAFELRRVIQICQEAGRHEQALDWLRRWPDLIPGSFAGVNLAPIWENLPPDQHDTVLHLLLSEVEKAPDNDGMQIALVELLRATGRYDEALQLARGNLAAQPGREAYEEQIFSIYSAAGRVDEAINLIQELLLESGRRNLPQLYVPVRLREVLVHMLLRADRSSTAIRDLNRWIEEATTMEERAYYLNLLALCYQENNNTAEALQTLGLALKLAPNDIGASNDLGYTLADAGRQLDRAEQLIRFALAAEPRNSAYLDSYGWLLYKRGDFAGAKRWLTRARFAGKGEDPVVCQHLGDACWRLGEEDAAKSWWTESTTFSARRLKQAWAGQQEARTLTAVKARLAAIDAGDPPPIDPTAEEAQAAIAPVPPADPS